MIKFYRVSANDFDENRYTVAEAIDIVIDLLDSGHQHICIYSITCPESDIFSSKENCLLAIGDMPY